MEPVFRQLDDWHRGAMLELVLTWGSLDVSLGYFASHFFPAAATTQIAEVLGKRRASAKLHQIVQLLRSVSGAKSSQDLRKALKGAKRDLEQHSKTRDLIAHAKCIGCREDDPEWIGFLKFERVSEDELAMYQVPITEIRGATAWGKRFDQWLVERCAVMKEVR
jgi:hypothetical protein